MSRRRRCILLLPPGWIPNTTPARKTSICGLPLAGCRGAARNYHPRASTRGLTSSHSVLLVHAQHLPRLLPPPPKPPSAQKPFDRRKTSCLLRPLSTSPLTMTIGRRHHLALDFTAPPAWGTAGGSPRSAEDFSGTARPKTAAATMNGTTTHPRRLSTQPTTEQLRYVRLVRHG